MLHLAMKAFYPAKPPFPFLHVDTTWKFKEMIAFRDKMAEELGFDLLVHVNPGRGVEQGDFGPFDARLQHPHPYHEDGGAAPGARQIWFRRGLRRCATRRGEVARQGADLLLPQCQPMPGTQRTSARKCGRPTTRASALVNRSASSRCRTGPSSISGSISCKEEIPIVPLYFASQAAGGRARRHADHGR
jgi:sulfate adenylyltransferase subunit 2